MGFLLDGTWQDVDMRTQGGQFIRKKGRPKWWIDNPDPKLKHANRPGAKTVNQWREDYLRDWQLRMDRCLKAK